MPTEKRERQRQGRQARLEAAEAARRHQQRNRTIRNVVILVVVVVLAAFGLSRFFGGDDKQAVSTNSSASTSDTATSDTSAPATPVSVTIPPAGASITGDTPCPPADGSAARTTMFAKPPPMCIDPNKTYAATISTSKGDVTVALDPKAAPQTVNNFVVLSRYHFYDGVAFHRVIQGFMDQTGDAVGPTPGQGGPGYTIPDEFPTGAKPYPEGTIAMANTGQPNSGGSQFFIVVGSGGDQLSPKYTAFGHVTSGQDVAQAINAIGATDQQGAPSEVVTIKSVTINES